MQLNRIAGTRCAALAAAAAVAFVVLAVASAPSPVSAAPADPAYTYGFADARAQGIFDEEEALDEEVRSFDVAASAVNNPHGHTPPDSAVESRAYGNAHGPFGVFVSVAGHADNAGPDDYEGLAATASAANYAEYRVASDTLAAGEPVTALLTFRIRGRIDFRDGSNGQLTGRGLSAFLFTDTQVGQNGGQMDIVYMGDSDFDIGGWAESDDFEADGTLTEHGPGHRSVVYNVTDTVEIATTVGSVLSVSMNLWAEAAADAPLDVSAIVDFSEGSTYALSGGGPDGASVSFVVVPEPASLALFGVAGLATLRRPRRRTTGH